MQYLQLRQAAPIPPLQQMWQVCHANGSPLSVDWQLCWLAKHEDVPAI